MTRTRSTSSPRRGLARSIAATPLLAALAVSLGLAAAAGIRADAALGAPAAATWRMHQLDSDRCWDAATIDADLNGRPETAVYDSDDDCRWDTRLANAVGGDDLLEVLTFDMDEDGHWEYWLTDTDQRPGFDVVYVDRDADGRYDHRWAMPKEPSAALGVIGGSPQRGGAMGLVEWLAAQTGRGVWSEHTDHDGDGVADYLDRDPRDGRVR